MKAFKVGDRVRILDVDRSMSPSREVRDKGTITDINTVSPGAVRVKCDTWKNDFNNGSWFHVRQLRILKKKAKPVVEERKARTAWIRIHLADNTALDSVVCEPRPRLPHNEKSDWFEFVEVVSDKGL